MLTLQATPFYFQHALDFLKGWPSPTAVDFSAQLSSNITAPYVYGGMVAHVNSVGQFELGAKVTQMPIFLIQSAGDYDVSNPTPAGANAWYPIAPAGHMSGLVASGAYELESTEFDPNGAYVMGSTPLHAPTEDQITGTDKTVAGRLFAQRNWPGGNAGAITPFTDSICAIVSRGARTNALRVPVLTFWPVFIPGTA